MNKIIFLTFCLISYLSSNSQNQFFTKKTTCGFQFSLSKKFVKSKWYNYYSNSMCFDTVLTNNEGIVINFRAINKGKGAAHLDSIDYTVIELERFVKDLQQDKNSNIISTNYISSNNIKFGKLEYNDKSDKTKLGYKYHLYIIFYIKKTIVVYISIDMKDTHNKNIDDDLINTIKET